MSLTFYAGKQDADGAWGPVVPFADHDSHIWVEDGEGNADLQPNPTYVPDASMTMAYGNAREVIAALCLDVVETALLTLDEARKIADRPTDRLDFYVAGRVRDLRRIILVGAERGATHIVIA